MGDVRTRRGRILAVVEDLATNFLYYDRKESQSLPMGDLEAAVEAGEISWQDIGDAFRDHLPDAADIDPASPFAGRSAEFRAGMAHAGHYLEHTVGQAHGQEDRSIVAQVEPRHCCQDAILAFAKGCAEALTSKTGIVADNHHHGHEEVA